MGTRIPMGSCIYAFMQMASRTCVKKTRTDTRTALEAKTWQFADLRATSAGLCV